MHCQLCGQVLAAHGAFVSSIARCLPRCATTWRSACDDPWHWSDRRHSAGGLGRRSRSVSVPAGVRAWLGLTPLQHSSGGKERHGHITKMGDKYLRKLLIVGMTSLIRRAKYKPECVIR